MAYLMPAGSAPDLKSPYVIKRKPPPSVSITERYPAPDPSDPFAPLWVLRHRTSSALHGSSLPSEATLSLDPRQRSNSTVNRTTTFAPSSNADSTFVSISTAQDSHHRLRSQSTAFLPSVTNLTSPRSGHAFVPQQRPIANKVHDSDTSGTESDTLVHQSRKASSPSIRRRSSSTQHRFARLLRSRKSGSIEAQSQATKAAELTARVRKGSVSGPVVSTVVWSTGGQGFVSIHKNPVYRGALPVSRNSVSLDAFSPQPALETVHSVSKDHSPSGILRRGHSHAPIPVSPPALNPLKKRRLSSVHLPLMNRGHDASYISNASHRNLRKSVSLAPDAMFRSSTAEPVVAPVPIAVTSSEWELPTQSQLAYAASLPIISEKGKTIPFGSIFANMRTIVVFIRHFWCPNCQDYMSSLTSFARPEILQAQSEKGGEVQLVIISNGAHTFIKKYRRIFRLPFRVYTDPTLGVYSALGMSKVNDASPVESSKRRRKMSLDETKLVSTRRGNYAKHGLMSGIAMVIVRALKVGIPLWEKGGDVAQLGGEFVLGPGLTASFAHRMLSTRGHAPVEKVLNAAYGSAPVPAPLPQPVVISNGCDVEGVPCNSVGFPCAHRIRRRPEHIKMLREASKSPEGSPRVVPRQSMDSSSRPRVDMPSKEVIDAPVEEKRPKKLPRIPVQKVIQVEERSDARPTLEKEPKVLDVVPRQSIDNGSRSRHEMSALDIQVVDAPVDEKRPKKLPRIPVQKVIQVEERVVDVKPNGEVHEKEPVMQLPEVPIARVEEKLDVPVTREVVKEGPKELPLVPVIVDNETHAVVNKFNDHDNSINSVDIPMTAMYEREAVEQPPHEDTKPEETPLPDLPVEVVPKRVTKL